MSLIWLGLLSLLGGAAAYFAVFGVWIVVEPQWQHPWIMEKVYFIISLLSSVSVGLIATCQIAQWGMRR